MIPRIKESEKAWSGKPQLSIQQDCKWRLLGRVLLFQTNYIVVVSDDHEMGPDGFRIDWRTCQVKQTIKASLISFWLSFGPTSSTTTSTCVSSTHQAPSLSVPYSPLTLIELIQPVESGNGIDGAAQMCSGVFSTKFLFYNFVLLVF